MPKQNPDVELANKLIKKRRDVYDKFYKYYNGVHALNYASEKYIHKFLERLKWLNANMCKRVVNAPVSRLEVIGFAAEDKEIVKQAWAIWKRSKMPLQSKSIFREAYRTGRGYCLVWQDVVTKKARLYPQDAKNCRVWKDGETGEAIKAAKLWHENKKWFLTLYYPDRIEKYETKAYFGKQTAAPSTPESFLPRQIKGENFPLANPWGRVPLFEFQPFEGESFLTDVIPVNDSLNKTLADIEVGKEYNTIRQRYTAGVVFDRDEETGRPVITFKHDDSIWSADDPEAKFGEFSDVDLEKFLKVAAETKQTISQVTGVPAHFFNLGTGDYPSGEALETAESPFVSIVEDGQLAFGETFGEAMAFALEIEKALKPDVALEVQWTDAGRPGLTKRLTQAAIKKTLGVSTKQILSELGYSEDQITQFEKDNREASSALGDTLGRIFDGGGSNAPDDSLPN